jgi:2-oxo-3-hexenedioate decarboxylase
MTDRIVAAAQGLLAARQENRIALLDAEIAPRDLTEAYAVHLELLDLLSANGGGPRIGWKVGFTNDAAQARMGTTEPVLAGLLGQHSYVGEAELASPGGKGLGVEAELAVRLRSPLAGSVSRQEAAAAIEAVAIAIEIVQKRGGPDEIGLPTLDVAVRCQRAQRHRAAGRRRDPARRNHPRPTPRARPDGRGCE